MLDDPVDSSELQSSGVLAKQGNQNVLEHELNPHTTLGKRAEPIRAGPGMVNAEVGGVRRGGFAPVSRGDRRGSGQSEKPTLARPVAP